MFRFLLPVAFSFNYSAPVESYPVDVSPYQGGWTGGDAVQNAECPMPCVEAFDPGNRQTLKRGLSHFQLVNSAPPSGYVWQVSQIDMRAYLVVDVGSEVELRLMRRERFNDADLGSSVVTLVAIDGGWQTVTSLGAHNIDPDYAYWLELDLEINGINGDAAVADVAITYRKAAVE